MLPFLPSVQYYTPLIAQGLGYFEEEGLNVDVQPSEGSSFVVQQVAAGNITIGLPGSQSILLGYQQSPNFKVVYVHGNRDFDIYVPDSSPIESVEDLAGGTVGSPDLAGGEALSLRINLEQAGVADEVRIEALGYNEPGMAEQISSGRVDALSVYWATAAIAEYLGIPMRCITCDPSQPQVGESWIVSEDYLAENPDAVIGVLRALAKATLFAQTNPDAAVAILQEVNPEGSQDPEQLRNSMDWALEVTAPPDEQPFGYVDLEAWQALMDSMLIPDAESGLTGPVDLDSLIDASLLGQANDFDHDVVIQEATEYPA
jgi:NitT/TauT family transport system substrate-binding protein